MRAEMNWLDRQLNSEIETLKARMAMPEAKKGALAK
jgi:hypothetical protein